MKKDIKFLIFFIITFYLVSIGLGFFWNNSSFVNQCSLGYGGLYIAEFNEDRGDTIFWWIIWMVFVYFLGFIIMMCYAAVAGAIMAAFYKQEFLIKKINFINKNKYTQAGFIFFLIISATIFRNITVFLFC